MMMQDLQPRRGADTRERLLALAESAVLEKGFAATSIEELIAGVGIILSKVVREKEALPRQMLLYRSFIKAVFLGT